MILSEIAIDTEHERVIECRDDASGYHGFIAVHSTALGPAVGGTRLWTYAAREDALDDVLRLSRGMTYKAALAGLPFGGGKAVIIGDTLRIDREAIFRAHGRFVQHLAGAFITAEDVGTSPADLAIVGTETKFAVGQLDPSPETARGVYHAMRAAAEHLWGSASLNGRTVSVQGCGNVGSHLARELHEAGASLIVCDRDQAKARRVAREYGARAVAPAIILDADADIFAPCALGQVFNDASIPRLRVGIVVGAANNQLCEPRHADALADRRVLYVPDYVANAGGIISGTRELLGWSAERSAAMVDEIYDVTHRILASARSAGISVLTAADRLAESRLAAAASGG